MESLNDKLVDYYNKHNGLSFTSPTRYKFILNDLVKTLEEQIPGDVIECGVYKGFMAGAMALCLEEYKWPCRLILFDVFEVLPKPDPNLDGITPVKMWHPEYLRTDVDSVRVHIENTVKNSSGRVVCHKGLVEETTRGWYTPIRFLSLDMDLYSGTKGALDNLYKCVSKGGYLHVDDYGNKWEGCKKAVDEYFSAQFVNDNFKKYPVLETSEISYKKEN